MTDPTPCLPSALSPAERSALIEGHQAFAVWCVGRFFPQLRGDARDEAIGAAMLGLVLAAGRFDPAHGAPFRAYAEGWVRQSISRQRRADRLRGMRPIRHDAPGVASIHEERGPTDISLEEFLIADSDPDPANRIDAEAMLAGLPERRRHVLAALYLGDESATDVAARLGISRTRVHQIRDQAIEQLREAFTIEA